MTDRQREMRRERDRRYRMRKEHKAEGWRPGRPPEGVSAVQMWNPVLDEEFWMPREERKALDEAEKAERREKYGPPLHERYGFDYPTVLRKRAIDILRTEIRLRHRLAANDEMRRLEAKLLARLDDCYGIEFDSFAQIEAFIAMSRREVLALGGLPLPDDVSPYPDEKAA